MREIKFRGLRIDGKGWVYGFLIKNEKISGIIPEYEITYACNGGALDFSYIEVIQESVGQFTGFKDKNGVDIYEGDICSGHSDGNGVITWTNFDGGYEYVFEDGANVGLWEIKRNLEVIRNIHETNLIK